ncbi:hypothetical protein FHR99_000508 [Litorivivens lipolytica]|uniref:Alpha/beta hydrolase family protein n=1 Tax=Litorivivens lipolytica TaxID=1524264 RepID=A0A7W4W3K7_9GAMM|nr:hypothetical protein [Litorivivens lipolytica]MBB3046272.1 hypothetical protein [Litorivivens lipolytica]
MPASSYKTLLILAATLLAACTSLTDQAKGFAREHGMRSDAIAGEPFTHQTFYKTGKAVDRLHIYIEGDGRPWLRGHLIADDPTPKTPLALELMARSPYTSLYLGRPCYFGYAKQPPCEPRYWTSARYSEAVVNSLAVAIQQIREPNQKLLLIGYSGGGTLATLLAQRLTGDIKVVTIAANLDTLEWSELHGYWPLSESLNPMVQATPPQLVHTHLAGGHDSVVPLAIIRRFSKQHGGTLREFEDYDHVCCWRENWPDILNNVL